MLRAALPCGTIGFASYLLTYYTIDPLYKGRKPFWPWKKLDSKPLSVVLSSTQLLGSTILASLGIAECNKEHDFMLMGVWMLIASISLRVLTMAAPFLKWNGV
jgi:hypothetical protein